MLSANMPYEMIKTINNKELPDAKLFDALPQYVPFKKVAYDTQYNDTTTKDVQLAPSEEERMEDSKWFNTAVFHHEYAHALYDLREDVKSEVRKAWKGIKADLNNDQIIQQITEDFLKRDPKEDKEKWLALLDCIQAATGRKMFDVGHETGYYKTVEDEESEILAHCGELLSGSNEIIKRYYPNAYLIMKQLIKSVIKR